MKHQLIEISVAGPVGSGKSHILATIEKALKETYGQDTNIVCQDLVDERRLVGTDDNMTRPKSTTIFALCEKGDVVGDPRC